MILNLMKWVSFILKVVTQVILCSVTKKMMHGVLIKIDWLGKLGK